MLFNLLVAAAAVPLKYSKVDIGQGIQLNVGRGGTGNILLLFLHGFPEGSAAWDDVITHLDTKTYTFLVPNQRGYNGSTQPAGHFQYNSTALVGDMQRLLALETHQYTARYVVAHDWGGPIGWILSSTDHATQAKLTGLIVMNGPHPTVLTELLKTNPAQQAASSYILFFQTPESTAALSANDYAAILGTFKGEKWFVGREQVYKDSYKVAPNALDAGLNWYRSNIYGSAAFDSKMHYNFPPKVYINIPTLVLWGMADDAFIHDNVNLLTNYTHNLQKSLYPNNTHWIAHQIPQTIAAQIDKFTHQKA